MTPYVEATVDGERKLFFNYHPGQLLAMAAHQRHILVLAGLQSGKTILGPWWLNREIMRKGPGDYLVVSPTFPLLNLKCLPEYVRLFDKRLGFGKLRYGRVLEISRYGERRLFGATQEMPTRIIFGHAQDPDALESATAKAAHLDECGQKRFRRGSHEAIIGRLSLERGRMLYTTTPYTLGWLKQEVYDRAMANHPEYFVSHFSSVMNPAFPQAEYDEQKATMPEWKFDMRYDGKFVRPAGMIYDCWTKANHCPDFDIPDHWPRYVGTDFGGVNTAGVFLAQELDREGLPTGRFYVYDEYLEGGRTSAGHAREFRRRVPDPEGNVVAAGGAPSEDQWRREFAAGGFPIRRPRISDVEVGIDRVWALVNVNRLIVFDSCTMLKAEFGDYARELDENDEPTEKIEDKEKYHLLDATRYIVTWIGHVDLGISYVRTSQGAEA